MCRGMMELKETHKFSKHEELANSITHGVGMLFSIVALVLLIIYSSLEGTAIHIVSFTVYGVTMVLLYTSSTLLHALPEGKGKNVFEILDHSSIYFFIAGCYTPLMLILVQGWLGWTMFGIIWFLAVGGTVFKSFFVRKYILFSTLLYVLMGWLLVFTWKYLVIDLASEGIVLLVIGGLLYTFGSIFYIFRLFKYHHAIWHLFVLGGTVAHFFMIVFYVLPN